MTLKLRGSQSWGSVRDILVSNFSAFLSEVLLGLFCKQFFSAFLYLWLECGKLETAEMRKIRSTEKKSENAEKSPSLVFTLDIFPWVEAQNLKKPADSSDWRQKLWKSRQATAIMWRHNTVVHDYSGT